MDTQNQNQNDELNLAVDNDSEIDARDQSESPEEKVLNDYLANHDDAESKDLLPNSGFVVQPPPEIEEVSEENAAADQPASEETTADGEKIAGSKFLIIKEIIENIKNELARIGDILGNAVPEGEWGELSKKLVTKSTKEAAGQMKVVEGVFDGQNMIGGDGEHYTVPANYASKSKLVEGDLLKLTILHDGSFIYKQIAPIERRRVVGILAYDESSDQHYVLAENKRWKVLRASITYYKGEPGDEVTIVVPKDTPSQWSAVDNIIKK